MSGTNPNDPVPGTGIRPNPVDDAVVERVALKSCPFCGKEAALGHIRYSRPLTDTTWADETPITEAHYVNCGWCGAVCRSGIVGGYQSKAEAVAAWNARHDPTLTTSQAQVEVLANACALYDDAIDMMFDGPDESDEGYARARWREARALVRQALTDTPNSSNGDVA